MGKSKRQRLIDCGPEMLADALLDLASDDATAAAVVLQLIAPPVAAVPLAAHGKPGEAGTTFKKKLANIRRRTRGYDWDSTPGFADELAEILTDLSRGVSDPTEGLGLVASFFEADGDIISLCDDSSGCVGEVFRHDATELFARYAGECPDQARAATLLAALYLGDEYGVRERLVGHVGRCFGMSGAEALIEVFQEQADLQSTEHARRRCLYAVESLARQTGNAELFERTRLASWPGPPGTAARIDIAEVYLETGSAETALSWLESVPLTESFMADERDALLRDAYEILGQAAEAEAAAWRIFRRKRSLVSLEDLLALVGHARRDEVIAVEMAAILADKQFSISDADFLVDLGRLDEAERYVVDRSDQIDGDRYVWLTQLAEALEAERPLAASAVYRALLDSILGRARSQAYGHGVRYLRKLERMAELVTDWGSLGGHDAYAKQLREQHKRKRSFWERYDD